MRGALGFLARRHQALVALGLGAALWEAAPRYGLADAALLPPLSRVLATGLALLQSGALARHVGASLWRVGLGYVLAVLVALPVGVAMGLLPRLDRYASPLLNVLRPISPPAWVPLAILWFGIGDLPAVLIVFIGTVLALIVGTATAARSVDVRLLRAALTLGATRLQLVRWVVVPALGPAIFGQMRVGLALAWMCVVAAEMVAVRSGLGYLLMEARSLFQTDRVLLCMLIIGGLGLGLDRLLRALEQRMLRWRRGVAPDELFAYGGRWQDLSG